MRPIFRVEAFASLVAASDFKSDGERGNAFPAGSIPVRFRHSPSGMRRIIGAPSPLPRKLDASHAPGGLGAFGEEGVAAVLALLHAELELVMRQTGTASLAEITEARIRRR